MIDDFQCGTKVKEAITDGPIRFLRVAPGGHSHNMQWNRSNAIGLAMPRCTWCHGQGIRIIRGATEVPCRCIFRAVFRACYNRFRECVALGEHTGGVSLEICRGAEGRRTYSRKREEYMCDFVLVSRRALNESEHKIFR